MMPKAECVILIVAAVAFSSVAALERLPHEYDSFKFNAYKLVDQCGAEYHIDRAAIDYAIDNDLLQDLDPCFLGCVLFKTDLIDETGKPTPEVASERMKKYISGLRYKNISAALRLCGAQVSAQSPKDTCESAKLFTPCLTEQYNRLYGKADQEY